MTTEARRSAAWLVAALAIASCAGSASQQASTYLGDVSLPQELRKDFEVFATNCSKCHDLSRAITAPIDDVEHWNRYVARMARTPGSGISPGESPAILRFLHWHTQQRLARREDNR